MSVLTRWLGGQPRLQQRDWMALASVGMTRPEQVVVASIDDNGARRVGMVFEQSGVRVDVDLPDPDETLRCLTEACVWRRGGAH